MTKKTNYCWTDPEKSPCNYIKKKEGNKEYITDFNIKMQ